MTALSESSPYMRAQANLSELKLDQICAAMPDYIRMVADGERDFAQAIAEMTASEVTARRERIMRQRIRSSGFPYAKTLADFDWSFQPSVPRAKVEELATLRFMDEAENILLVGSPGVGKTRGSNAEENALTRECIEAALVLLMEEKPYERITVTDITRKAGVSRTAYYRNYASKEDILAGRIRAIARELSAPMLAYDAKTQTFETWMALLGAVAGMASEYRLLLDAGFGDMMAREFAASMNEGAPEGDVALRYSNAYWAGALSSVIAEWVRGGMSVPADQVARVGTSLMLYGVRTAPAFGNKC